MELENIVVDYETHWGRDYSLKKLSTSEYVRDPRFRVMGVSILRESEQYQPRFLNAFEYRPYLASIDWSRVRMIAHNMHFDGLVHAEREGIIPAQYFCTMSAARYVHRGVTRHSVDALAKHYKLRGKLEGLTATKDKQPEDLTADEWASLAEYAIHDGKLELYYYFKLSPLIPATELEIMDETFRMFCDPVLEVDLDLACQALDDACKQRADRIGAADVDIAILRSREKFANLLRDIGIEPPMKISKTTGKPTYAFARNDEAFVELLEHPDDDVRTLIEAKLESSSNIAVTRAERLIRMGESGKLAVALHPWGAKTTLRWSGANKMNMQNFVRGSKLRRAIRAPKDHVLVMADQSQIECRINAWFAGQDDLLRLFRDRRDPYNDMASTIYGREIDRKRTIMVSNGEIIKPDALEGFVGKTATLSLGYQAGAHRLRHALATSKEMKVKLPIDECFHIVNTYRTKNWRIASMWEQAREWLHFLATGSGRITYKCITLDADTHKIWGPDGTFLYYPGLSCNGGEYTYIDNGGADSVYIYGGKLIENIIQWLSRTIIAANIRTIRAQYKVACMVHDDVLSCVRRIQAEAALARILSIMRTPPVWAPDLPLDAEGAWDVCYSK